MKKKEREINDLKVLLETNNTYTSGLVARNLALISDNNKFKGRIDALISNLNAMELCNDSIRKEKGRLMIENHRLSVELLKATRSAKPMINWTCCAH